MIYSFYIFTGSGACLYEKRWGNRSNRADGSQEDATEEKRLLFGLLFSLKEFVTKIQPRETMPSSSYPFNPDASDADRNSSASTGLQRFQTDAYTCHHFEAPTGLRFVLITDNLAGDLSTVLKHIYSQIYVETVVNNPLGEVKSNKPIENERFESQLQRYIQGLACAK